MQPIGISYPTDLNLLNRARIITEKIIDIKFNKKPSTQHQTAKKEYLPISKKIAMGIDFHAL